MAYLSLIWFCVIIAMTASMPQFFPNQNFPQQPNGPPFPNQGFPNQNFPGQGFNQGFPNQGFGPGQQFPNQGFPTFPNQGGFQNQQQPNQSSQNNQFVPNPSNPFLQGNSNQNQNLNPNRNPSTAGTLEEFMPSNQNQNQRPFNQAQAQPQFNQQQPQFNQQRPAQQSLAVPATTPGAFPAQSPEFLACTRNCPTTSEYNPVCGSDQVGYPNIYRLNCANQCGQRLIPSWQTIQVSRQGACTSGQRVA